DQSYITGSTWNNGVAYKAKISFADVVDCSGNFSNFTYLTILSDAYSDGARIHSNSWGYGSSAEGDYNYEAVDADAFMWNHKDFLIFFAAGNDGPTYRVEPPATAKDIVTVGATGGTDNASYSNRDEDQMTDYSCPGPCDDGRRKPTVTAPGHWIASVDNDDGNCCPNCAATCAYESTFTSGIYTYLWTGTSMACPAAAGAGVLVRQYFTEGWYPSGTKNPSDAFTPSAALIKAVLVNGAMDMTGESDWPTMNQGFGRVELENVLYFAGDSRVLNVVDETAGLAATGEADTYYYNVGSTQPLEITLVWTDHDASALADPCIVNDLDLTVHIGGNTYLGNVFSGRQSTTGGSYDRLNVVEEVLLKNPPAAECTVIVRAYDLAYTPQPYALVVTGDLPTNRLPYAPILSEPFDNARITTTTPQLVWQIPSDGDGDSLHFRVQIDDDPDFSSPFATIESKNNSAGFSCSLPAAEGSGTCGYTINSQGEGTLADGTTYYWHVSAWDGTAYGPWSEVHSLTVNTAQAKTDWFQTKSAQFITDFLVDADTSGDAVILPVVPGSSEELYWDDGGTECNYFSSPYYFACLFQPGQPCTLKTAKFYISRSSRNTSASCSLFVWEYSGSTPNAVVYGPVAFRPEESGWVSVDLPTPYYDSDGQFWVGAFFPNDESWLRYLRLCSENNAPVYEKTYYSSSRNGPWSQDAGYDDYIRVVVQYPADTTDSGWVYSTPVVLGENPDSPVGWNRVLWTETDNDSILVTVQYRSGGAWQNFGDTATVTVSDSGQLDISSLSAETLRVVGILYRKPGESPALEDWAVTYNYGIGIDLLVGDETGDPYTEWALGNLAPGEVRIMDETNCVYVKNTGAQAINVAITASEIDWTYSDHIGADTCVLMALFNGSTPPAESDFSTDYDTLGTNERMAGTSPDGKFAGDSNDGVNIPPGDGEKLYFYFRAPDPNSNPNQQDITITVRAVAY
ncbi:S8 family serine peptidase, partial [bacterium]|nr:S8 family serine peptidase [bacterium]